MGEVVKMSQWYYEKKDLKKTPSLADNIESDIEQRYRREGARFIINVGTKMGLRYDTMATGVVYFHRFYMFHSFKTFPRYVTACCCLFLAGKVEETPKKCKDIIKIARTLLTDNQFAQFGEDPKEEVMTLERILLQTIRFDLQVDHPYSYLLRYAKQLKGDKSKLQKLVQMAWTFVNDSLCTTLCLQWEPEIIAIALMYLASKLSKFEVTDWQGRSSKQARWWDMFVEDMSVELMEDICHQVLDLYSTPVPETPQDSPPNTPPTPRTGVKKVQPGSPSIVTPPQGKKDQGCGISPAQPIGMPIPRLEGGDVKSSVPPPTGSGNSLLGLPHQHSGSLTSTTMSGEGSAANHIPLPQGVHPYSYNAGVGTDDPYQNPYPPITRAQPPSQGPAYSTHIAYQSSYHIDSRIGPPPPPPPALTATYGHGPYYTSAEQQLSPYYQGNIPPLPHELSRSSQGYQDPYAAGPLPPPPAWVPPMSSSVPATSPFGQLGEPGARMNSFRYHHPPSMDSQPGSATGIPTVRITGRF